jgi:uncharacterized DUF497 family protein
MSKFDWDDEKNLFLEKTRGIGFEDVVFHIENGDVLDVIRHPNKDRYPNQNIIILNVEGYVYCNIENLVLRARSETEGSAKQNPLWG